MNEQIKELHEQACKLDWEQYPNAIPDGERIQQKFAELIVRECAKVADDNFNKGFCPVGDYIKQHFGVAELQWTENYGQGSEPWLKEDEK